MFYGKSVEVLFFLHVVISRTLSVMLKENKFTEIFKLPDFFWLIHPTKLLIRANTV